MYMYMSMYVETKKPTRGVHESHQALSHTTEVGHIAICVCVCVKLDIYLSIYVCMCAPWTARQRRSR